MSNDPTVWNEEYQAEAVRLAKQVRGNRHKYFTPIYQGRLLLADALMHALDEIKRLQEAKRRALKIADERAKELATLRGEPVRITGAISLVEEAACLIWHELYPDVVMDEGDLPHYEAAAKAVLALAAAPDWKQDQAETSRLAGETGE